MNHLIRQMYNKTVMRGKVTTLREDHTTDELYYLIENVLPQRKEDAMIDTFNQRISEMTHYVSFIRNARREAHRKDFRCALNVLNHQWWQNLNANQRTKLCRRMNHRRRIYDRWNKIINNICAPHIKKVDIRQLSFDGLARAHKPSWVDKKEEELLLKDQTDDPNDHKIYSSEQIEELASMIVTNHTILQEVGWDPDQIEMICKDLKKRLKRMANNV